MSVMTGEKDRWEEGETQKLPPELQKALDRFLREHRRVFEALARRT